MLKTVNMFPRAAGCGTGVDRRSRDASWPGERDRAASELQARLRVCVLHADRVCVLQARLRVCVCVAGWVEGVCVHYRIGLAAGVKPLR